MGRSGAVTYAGWLLVASAKGDTYEHDLITAPGLGRLHGSCLGEMEQEWVVAHAGCTASSGVDEHNLITALGLRRLHGSY